jgi:hypothetical protein
MELLPWEFEDYCIGRIIMVPYKDDILSDDDILYSFYKIVKITDKMFYIKKMKSETKFIKMCEVEEGNTPTKIYEAVISKDFDEDSDKSERRIKKENITKYSISICSIVQYEV